jgi:plastocyanin
MKKATPIKWLIIINVLFLFSVPQVRGDASVRWNPLDSPAFVPESVTVSPGDSVTWWNDDPLGRDLYAGFSPEFGFVLPPGNFGQFLLPTAGVYGYVDQFGNQGVVIVAAPPTVSITSPTNTAVFTAPATFTIQATASAGTGDALSDVKFFLNAGSNPTLIADVTTPPYAASITNLDVGTYTLVAEAAETNAGYLSSATITITVTPPPISLVAPRNCLGEFLFDLTGLAAGKTNVVLASPDLVSWTAVETNIATDTSLTVTNPMSATCQFYRVLQMP